MVPVDALIPVVLLLSLGVEAAPSDRRSWGRAFRRDGTPTLRARAVATTTARASTDLQSFNTGAGGVFAPAVTTNGNYFYQSNLQYNYLYDALVNSCYAQANSCGLSFNVIDKSICWGTQVWACTGNAQTAANSYSSAAVAWSSSAASANYAAATQARSGSGDLQTFTGALGGIVAPAVTVSGNKWVSSGQTYNFLKEALDGSCYYQMNQCQLAANNGGNKLELTVANCNGPQITACLAAETAILASASAAATASAAAWSASASAFSASQNAAASQSASLYSYSSAAAASAAAQSASLYSYSSSSSAAAARAASTSKAASSSSSTASSSTSSTGATPTTAPSVAGNLQTFSGNVGVTAPAVTANADGSFSSGGTTYARLVDALSGSCYAQAASCQASSIADRSPCWGNQITSCLTTASTIASGYSSNAAVYSSSVASANLAKATASRTVAGDVQTFTGALGGIAAPAVTGAPMNWWMNGIYFYNLIDALSQSCYVQQGLCEAAATKAGFAYEMTISNCDNVQTPACLSAAQNIVANYGKSSSSSAVSTAAPSSSSAANNNNNAAAWSAQQSASAYSQSSLAAYSASTWSAQQAQQSQQAQAQQYSQSASAYSASASAYSAQQQQAQQSAQAYSQSASAYSASASAYSAQQAQAQQSAAAYSQSSAAAYSQASAAAYSQASAAAYSQASAAAYSQASAAAYSQASAAAYSSALNANNAAASASAYSASSAAAWSASSSAAAAQATNAPDGWSIASTACIAEGTTGRALTGASTSGSDMTWQKCTSFCSSNGFPLAGLEYSSECYCGAVLSNGASLNRPSSQCNMKASGNNAQIAGGPNAITLFVSNSLDKTKYTSDLSGVVTTIPDGWQIATSGGSGICVLEGTSGRALVAASTAADDMTIGKCISFCKSKGQQYAGLEYSRECFCGNDIINGASLSRTGPCNMQCAGAPGTICGGPGLLSVYMDTSLKYTNTQVGQYSKQGCIQEVGGRALTGASTAGSDMTLEKCTNFCQQGGFAFAGLEYAGECYCGNGMSNGASFTAWSTECKMPCSGNSNQICGGPNAISLYSTQAGLALIGA